MIILTSRQMAVYSALRVKTAGGSRSWAGRLKVGIASRSMVSHTMSQLVTLGVVSSEPAGRVNRYRILVDHEDIKGGSRGEIMRARCSGKGAQESTSLVDSGEFGRRWAALGLPSMEDDPSVPAHEPVHHPYRPDARAL